MSWLDLLWSGVWRRPVRTALTAASLAMAFLLFGLVTPILLLFGGRGDLGGVDRLVVQPRHSITDFLPVSHEAAVREIAGVRATSHQTWFGGIFRDGADPSPRWAVPAKSYLGLRPEIVLEPAARATFLATRTGAIVGVDTARRHGLAPGDRIAFVPDIWSNADGKAWDLEIVGIFEGADRTVDTSALYFHYAFFDEYRAWGEGLVSYLLVGVEPTHAAAEVAAAIDARFANSADETTTSSERDFALRFADRLGNVRLMLSVVLGAVLFTIALVAVNTVAHGVRERMTELAVLNAVGFDRRALVGLVFAEALVLVLLGALPGTAAAAVLVVLARRTLDGLGAITLDATALVGATAVVLALAVLATVQPAARLLRVRLVDALRT